MTKQELIETEKQVLLNTYTRPPFVISHGKGMYLYDTDGNRYLDFMAGIAVNAVGYGDEGLLKVLNEQARKLWHCSNLFYNEPQVRLAKLLVDNTFADKVFFSNSGSESIEGAIKFARKLGHADASAPRTEIISFRNSFHGRTMGALSATGQEKFQQGFEPLLPGFVFAEFNDLDSVARLVNANTCAILVEPVQGEGGIFPAEKGFMQGLAALAAKNGCLIILDEIQCGLGRTGRFCAHEHYGMAPDIMALAKPIAGGLPLGAILVNDRVAAHIQAGNHGSTFGGGPLVTAVAEYVVSRILAKGFLDHVRETGAHLLSRLAQLQQSYPVLSAIRGTGLMVGVEFTIEIKKIMQTCQQNGLLLCKSGDKILRFLPPLIAEKSHIDEALHIFENALQAETDHGN